MQGYQNLGIEKLYLNIIKVTYYKTIAILLNEENSKEFTHTHTHISGTR